MTCSSYPNYSFQFNFDRNWQVEKFISFTNQGVLSYSFSKFRSLEFIIHYSKLWLWNFFLLNYFPMYSWVCLAFILQMSFSIFNEIHCFTDCQFNISIIFFLTLHLKSYSVRWNWRRKMRLGFDEGWCQWFLKSANFYPSQKISKLKFSNDFPWKSQLGSEKRIFNGPSNWQI